VYDFFVLFGKFVGKGGLWWWCGNYWFWLLAWWIV